MLVPFLLLIALPIAAAVVLLWVRRKHGFEWFVGTSLACLAAVASVCLFTREVMVSHTSGTPSSALVVAMAGIVALCIPRFTSRWLAILQVFGAVLVQNAWCIHSSWVA